MRGIITTDAINATHRKLLRAVRDRDKVCSTVKSALAPGCALASRLTPTVAVAAIAAKPALRLSRLEIMFMRSLLLSRVRQQLAQ